MRETAFRLSKGRFTDGRRRPFIVRKAAFCMVKGIILFISILYSEHPPAVKYFIEYSLLKQKSLQAL